MTAIKNILFDLGGVLYHIDYYATIKAFKKLGIKNFHEHFSQQQQNNLFDRLETGKISVGGFIKEQVRPHLSSGEEKLDSLKKMVEDMPGDVRSDFYAGRLERLSRWSSRAKVVLPLLQKFLGS